MPPPPTAESPAVRSLERLLKLFASGVLSLLSSLHLPLDPPRDEP